MHTSWINQWALSKTKFNHHVLRLITKLYLRLDACTSCRSVPLNSQIIWHIILRKYVTIVADMITRIPSVLKRDDTMHDYLCQSHNKTPTVTEYAIYRAYW